MCKYVCWNWLFKYKIQYEIQFICLGSLGDTLCRFIKVNHNITTQLSIIITGLLTTLDAMYWNVSKITDKSGPDNPRIQFLVLIVTSSGCLKTVYLNPCELVVTFNVDPHYTQYAQVSFVIFNVDPHYTQYST